jgi:hypothetical protein
VKRLSSFLSLFTSISTLVCCALPTFFVVLGAGATFAGLIGSFPQLVWISENKMYFFTFGAVMLSIAGFLHWRSRNVECPVDELGEACATTRDWSLWVYFASLVLYLVGAGFAFLPNF